MQSATIRPGLLVHLSVRVVGNVRYRREDVEAAHTTASGELKAKWETERTVLDPEEHARAEMVRAKARATIAAQCISTGAFGLLCLSANEKALSAAMDEARAMAREFNDTARLTTVQVRTMTGRIAENDLEATRQINAEIAGLLDRMEQGTRRLDVDAIRDAAKEAKTLAAMVSPEASERLQNAIDCARAAARKIVKAGEAAAVEIDQAAIRAITESRTAFLDLDDDGREIAAPTVTGRALDLDTPAAEPAPVKASAPTLDMFND